MKTRKKRKKTGISLEIFFLTCLLLFCAQHASPQSTNSDSGLSVNTRTIEGKVLAGTGAGVPGAVVLLKDNKTLQVRSYIAQSDGGYHFFGLSTDVNYTLRAENQDLTSKPKTVSVFDSHRNVKLNLKLTEKIKAPKK